MTELDHIIARLSRLGVITSTDEAPGSVLSKAPESKFADDTSLDKHAKDDCSDDLASTKFAQLSRVDSHEGGADSITPKSQLAQTQEELQRVEDELHQAKDEIEKLRREAESYKPNTESVTKPTLGRRRVKRIVTTPNTVSTATGVNRRNPEERVQSLTAELETTKAQLVDVSEKFETQTAELSKVKTDLDIAKPQISALSRRRNDKSLQFRVVELQDGTLDTQIDLIRTFHYGSRPAYQTWVPEYSRPTIAYMDLKDHLAKNGKLSHEDYINSSYWAAEAYKMFKYFESPYDHTYFQHAEPQLMALCVDHFLETASLSLDQFKDKKPIHGGVVNSMPEVVEIFASRKPCGSCEDIKVLVNKIALHYNFQFELTYARALVSS
ncbi:hypothetical protein J4E90_003746 [Alternaria incomplexa]|uniref:uncharacterized protein n=1 Tax=Alternaria incomplexa TaxID=1187928 RepID=UPI00221E58EC|nr:uncharacterized protein J4E90_003746 [Alternaria incomplexa]KAI4917239.1 hypothetical protein J4E90_003746 [Alternaria incomplexa]